MTRTSRVRERTDVRPPRPIRPPTPSTPSCESVGGTFSVDGPDAFNDTRPFLWVCNGFVKGSTADAFNAQVQAFDAACRADGGQGGRIGGLEQLGDSTCIA